VYVDDDDAVSYWIIMASSTVNLTVFAASASKGLPRVGQVGGSTRMTNLKKIKLKETRD
jgi:hypothetical protein